MALDLDFSFQDEPIDILDRQTRKLRFMNIDFMKSSPDLRVMMAPSISSQQVSQIVARSLRQWANLVGNGL